MKCRLASLLLLAALASGLMSACGAGGTGDKGYVDGNGIITQVAAADRQAVGTVKGTTLEGKPLDLKSYAGKVVVLNVWGAWCPPCRAEATRLAEASRTLANDGVVFIGINTRDASRDQGLAFQRRYGVDYPSLYDPDGQTLLAFRGTITPQAIPSTLVIDKQGRVSASILGEVTSVSTLIDLVGAVTK